MSGVGVQPASFGGRYQILAPLASGGMADLFLARAVGIKGFVKTVVIKRVRRDRDAHGDMLLDEARIAAQLVHPNIVQVHDLGAEQGGYFLAMEYVPGPDLRALARQAGRTETPLPLELALHIILEVSAGLHHAHELATEDGRPLDIVHRDVSPANILISRDGAVKITDFGIAKFSSEREVETATGTVKGKFSYMSPEQASGLDIDRRSDVFSLGVVLWEITTGRRLFTGKNDLQVLQKVIHHPITRPSQLVPDYLPGLEAIVMRALDRDRAARYQTVEQLMWDLEDLVETRGLTGSARRLGRYVSRLFPADQPAADMPTQIAAGTPSAQISVPAPSMSPLPSVPRLADSSAEVLNPLESDPTQVSSPGVATPVVVAYPVQRSPETGTAFVEAGSSGRAKWIAIGFILTLALGASALVAGSNTGGGDPPATEPAAAPASDPAVQPVPEPETESESETESETAAAGEPEAKTPPEPEPAAEPEPAPTPEARTPEPEPTAGDTDDRDRRRAKRRRDRKKTKKKKKWTEDSPLPPSRSDADSALLPSRRSD